MQFMTHRVFSNFSVVALVLGLGACGGAAVDEELSGTANPAAENVTDEAEAALSEHAGIRLELRDFPGTRRYVQLQLVSQRREIVWVPTCGSTGFEVRTRGRWIPPSRVNCTYPLTFMEVRPATGYIIAETTTAALSPGTYRGFAEIWVPGAYGRKTYGFRLTTQTFQVPAR